MTMGIWNERRALERDLLGRMRLALYVNNPAQINIKQVTRMTGRRRVALDTGADAFSQLVGTDTINGITVEFRGAGKGRSYHRKGDVWLSTNSRAERSVIHELGHVLEYHDQEVHQKALDFLEARTAGEKEEWLGDHYDKHEKTRKDEFINPYMGKDYGERATEVVSMGLEYMYAEPDRLAREDAGYFDFMYDLLRGR